MVVILQADYVTYIITQVKTMCFFSAQKCEIKIKVKRRVLMAMKGDIHGGIGSRSISLECSRREIGLDPCLTKPSLSDPPGHPQMLVSAFNI
jgi:hypothetical protein